MVAVPERRWMKFSAVRSAVRIEPAFPETERTASPGWRAEPFSLRMVTASPGSTRRKTSAATSTPARQASCRVTIRACDVALGLVNHFTVTSSEPISSARARSMMSGALPAMGGQESAVTRAGRPRSRRCQPMSAGQSGSAAVASMAARGAMIDGSRAISLATLSRVVLSASRR